METRVLKQGRLRRLGGRSVLLWACRMDKCQWDNNNDNNKIGLIRNDGVGRDGSGFVRLLKVSRGRRVQAES